MKKTILVTALLASAAWLSPASATAIPTPITGTGTLTSDHCDPQPNGCGGPNGQPGGFGTITVVSDELGTGGNVGTLAFTIQLNTTNGNNFVTGGQDVTFGFDLAGNPTINYSVLPTSPDLAVASWSVVGGNPQAAGTLHADGFGDVEYGVKLAGSGNSPPRPNSLTFSISAVNLNFADLETIMVADIFSGTTLNTGFVDFTGNLVVTQVPGPIVGAGIPGLLTACFGMFGLNRWRRRRQAA